MSDTELAWAAGFFDGEGCTSYYTRTLADGSTKTYVGISVGQRDPRPLARFAAVAGVGAIYTNGPRVLQWKVSGRKAEEVMARLWPYLSEPKREQFLAVKERDVA